MGVILAGKGVVYGGGGYKPKLNIGKEKSV